MVQKRDDKDFDPVSDLIALPMKMALGLSADEINKRKKEQSDTRLELSRMT